MKHLIVWIFNIFTDKEIHDENDGCSQVTNNDVNNILSDNSIDSRVTIKLSPFEHECNRTGCEQVYESVNNMHQIVYLLSQIKDRYLDIINCSQCDPSLTKEHQELNELIAKYDAINNELIPDEVIEFTSQNRISLRTRQPQKYVYDNEEDRIEDEDIVSHEEINNQKVLN